jgi:UDP-2,4-diacetamido-2,4,6-trideoxy-beta-L-altropyranose hydrolase
MKPSPLCIRADADARMGTGHLMRCLALAQAWQEAGGEVMCLTDSRLPALNARLQQEGLRLEQLTADPGSDADADQTRETAERLGTGWVVLDGYHFSGAFQQRVRQGGIRVLAIDDYGHAEHYAADLVLNQNLHATEQLYCKREPHTRLLLGTRFALLRREFWERHGGKRDVPTAARKVLVTLGGSDPDKVTLKVIEALRRLEMRDLEAVVVVGGGNPHLVELQAAARRTPGRVSLLVNVTNMPEWMAWADVAVAAGGTTTWERALMGLPSLVIVLSDNQKDLARTSEQLGLGWDLGEQQELTAASLASALRRLLSDRQARAEMARRGPLYVDGKGAGRVAARMRAFGLKLRPADAEDCRLIWHWANEPATRLASFSSEPIPWERHQHWFRSKLNDPRCVFFIAVNVEGDPIGQVRFEVTGEEAVISVGLAERFHGRGYGPEVIQQGAEAVFAGHPVQRINAYIRTENGASYRAFEKAGFTPVETTTVRGNPAHRLVLQKEQVCIPL